MSSRPYFNDLHHVNERTGQLFSAKSELPHLSSTTQATFSGCCARVSCYSILVSELMDRPSTLAVIYKLLSHK